MSQLAVQILKNLFTYTYLISSKESGSAVLIDPVWDIFAINKKLEQLTLRGILLTHHHFDHVNLADKLAAQWEVPVYISREEAGFYDFRARNLVLFDDGEILSFGEIRIKTLLTPGHTRGGACFVADNNIFTGDTVFIEGCGLCSFEGGDPASMFDSLRKIRDLAPPEMLVFPGHSYGISPGQPFEFLAKNNVYFNISERKRFIDFRMRPNQTGLFDFK